MHVTIINDVKRKVRYLARDKHFNLVLDMGVISFIDSSGLGVLVVSFRSAYKIGGNINIASLKDRVMDIFE